MEYGSDMRLDDKRDIIFTPDGDVEVQDGARLVAQDVVEELSIAFGSVEWDRTAGSHLLSLLNTAEDASSFVVNELERIALKDVRVDAATVLAEQMEDGRFRLSFRVVGELETETLLFDMKDLMGGING